LIGFSEFLVKIGKTQYSQNDIRFIPGPDLATIAAVIKSKYPFTKI